MHSPRKMAIKDAIGNRVKLHEIREFAGPGRGGRLLTDPPLSPHGVDFQPAAWPFRLGNRPRPC
jgi:hypothetical protein